MYIRLLLLSAMASALIRCQPLPEDLPAANQLVIWSILSPDEVIRVSVKPLLSPLSGERNAPSVTDAKVQVLERGELVQTLQFDAQRGDYTSPNGFKPLVGRQYVVRVEAPGYPVAESAPELILAVPVFSDIIAQRFMRDRVPVASVKLISPEPLSRYLSIKSIVRGMAPDTFPIYFSVKDNDNCPELVYAGDSLSYVDLFCQGGLVSSLSFETSFYLKEALDSNPVRIEVGASNATFYRFAQDALQQAYSVTSSDALGFGALRVYSNINGGAGLVACRSVKILFIKV